MLSLGIDRRLFGVGHGDNLQGLRTEGSQHHRLDALVCFDLYAEVRQGELIVRTQVSPADTIETDVELLDHCGLARGLQCGQPLRQARFSHAGNGVTPQQAAPADHAAHLHDGFVDTHLLGRKRQGNVVRRLGRNHHITGFAQQQAKRGLHFFQLRVDGLFVALGAGVRGRLCVCQDHVQRQWVREWVAEHNGLRANLIQRRVDVQRGHYARQQPDTRHSELNLTEFRVLQHNATEGLLGETRWAEGDIEGALRVRTEQNLVGSDRKVLRITDRHGEGHRLRERVVNGSSNRFSRSDHTLNGVQHDRLGWQSHEVEFVPQHADQVVRKADASVELTRQQRGVNQLVHARSVGGFLRSTSGKHNSVLAKQTITLEVHIEHQVLHRGIF
mmetsp:Transcript_41374/g.71708  ORF Transcript_41374/g.71708 Transcript_41374/m.71708 type:complete len:387 (+) Transcript_41374:624-1784(+)